MKNLVHTLEEFKKKRILVMGDIILDKFSWGKIDRINPEQPAAQLVKIIKEDYTLGGAANVANNITSLGANCSLYGVIGRDFFGEKIDELCKNNKIYLEKFYYTEPTLVKQRIMAHGQQITRLDYGETNLNKIDNLLKEGFLTKLKENIKNYDFVILSDYNKGFFDKDFSKGIISQCNLNNIPVLVDPKPENFHFFENCNIVCPNKHEAEKITEIKYTNGKETLVQMGKILSNKINADRIIITCGEDGVFSYDRKDGKTLFIGTKARKVADVTGAGDTFAAAISLGLSSGLSLNNASILANYASGIVVEKVGTATPTIEEIKRKIKESKI